MPAILGNKRKCYIATSASVTTGTALKGETSNNVTFNKNLVEVSDKDSDWQTFINGVKGATGTASVNADDSDPNQKKLITSLDSEDKVYMFIGEVSGEGSSVTFTSGYVMEILISSLSETNDNGSVATRQFNFTVNGKPTFIGLA